VPAGAQPLRVWHPYLRTPGNAIALTVNVPRDGAVRQALTGELRVPLEQRRMY
jgi:hypothetical protein